MGSGKILTTKSITVRSAPVVVMETPSLKHCALLSRLVQAALTGLRNVRIMLMQNATKPDLPASEDGDEHSNQTQCSVQTHHHIYDPSETLLSQVFDEP